MGWPTAPVLADRGRDSPIFYHKHRNGRDVRADYHKPQPCIIKVTRFDGPISVWGSTRSRENLNVKSSFTTDTQYPAVRLSLCLNPEGGKFTNDALMSVFGGCIVHQSEDGSWGIESFMNNDQELTDGLPDHPQLQDLHRLGQLWETRIKLLPINMINSRFGAHRPRFTRISEEEVSRQCLLPTDGGRMLDALWYAVEISIYRVSLPGMASTNRNFTRFFMPAMAMSIEHGYLWHYRLCNEEPFDGDLDEDFDWNDCPPPSWLVTRWGPDIVAQDDAEDDAEGDVEGDAEIDAVERWPLRWSSWRQNMIYPYIKIYAHMMVLATAREQAHQMRFIGHVAKVLGSDRINCEFLKHEFEPGSWIVCIKEADVTTEVRNSEQQTGGHGSTGRVQVIPNPGTRISVHLRLTEGQREIRLEGTIIEPPVFNVPAASGYAIVRGSDMILEDVEYSCLFKVNRDMTPMDRALFAVGDILKPKYTDGLPFGLFLTGYQRTGLPFTPLGTTLDNNDRAIYENAIKTCRKALDDHQLAAALAVVKESNPGLTIVHGPPGTGKTLTGAAVTIGLMALWKRVLVCGPSDSSVLSIKQAIKDDISQNSQLVHFHSQYETVLNILDIHDRASLSEHPFIDSATGKPQVDNQEALFTAVTAFDDPVLSENKNLSDGYGWQFLRHVDRMRQYENPGKALADRYVDALNISRERGIDRATVEECERTIAETGDRLVRDFWQRVRVVFSTLTDSGHDICSSHFKPDVLVVDGAALVTNPELAISLSTFRNSLKAIILLGDTQQRPTARSRERNECYDLLQYSAFERLMDDSANVAIEKHYLGTQYRMHPDISMTSGLMYNDLADAACTRDWDALQVTCNEFFARFRPAWNGRLRMAIDVGNRDPMKVSEKHGNTSSYHNVFEARLVVDLTLALLAFTPTSPHGRKIVPADIKIVTPEIGQRAIIIQMLQQAVPRAARDTNYFPLLPEVWTTEISRSCEAEIQLISLTKRDHEDPLDVRIIAKTSLSVLFSRAKKRQIVFGNFDDWCKEAIVRKQAIFAHRSEQFRKVIQSFWNRCDILSESQFADGLNLLPVAPENVKQRLA